MTTDVTAKDFNPSNNELVDQIKQKANELAEVVNQLPASRRRSIALTHVETASMFAVKAVFYDDDNQRTDA
ncbi:hypothetical protein T8A63_07255 [Sulfitobacter sp. OXR-159]|uniref:Acb2/Tad1 domain-containing protein n=1 Tax=unclassified Sulfitobacter TaxID=196795 RepID=UPI002AC8CAFF|nr:hypothetical protein [Sulfitobacter sp. OXR-159]WPZ30752.1 hypothetical protein T8A63_06745 [Sulfitobacter sp. OXR-159]WPZ30853.1 hypothetical protein T8A63_07255 [Sulfitobacter sp. OXR-159]